MGNLIVLMTLLTLSTAWAADPTPAAGDSTQVASAASTPVVAAAAPASAASTPQSVHLFSVSSPKFTDVVEFRAMVNPDCTFAAKNPVTAQWQTTAGEEVKKPSFIQREVMKFVAIIIDSQEAQKLIGEVKAIASHDVKWPLSVILGQSEQGECQGVAQTTDVGDIVNSISIVSFKGSFPTDILINGILHGEEEQRQKAF